MGIRFISEYNEFLVARPSLRVMVSQQNWIQSPNFVFYTNNFSQHILKLFPINTVPRQNYFTSI